LAISHFSFGQISSNATDGCEVTVFGKLEDGRSVELFTLTNGNGMSVKVMNWGATLVEVNVPDSNGKVENVNLGLPSFERYAEGHPALGSTIGRYANRIGNGGFTLDGQRYDLQSTNRHGVQIHGGRTGFGKQLWEAQCREYEHAAGVRFCLVSPDGHEGFPGRLIAEVQFLLTSDNALVLDYKAKTTRPTHVNFTNHAYWNLEGAGSGPVLEHRLQVNAEKVLAADERLVPTGEILPVEGTPLDLREPRGIGERIGEIPSSIGGYDHCYVLAERPILNNMASQSEAVALLKEIGFFRKNDSPRPPAPTDVVRAAKLSAPNSGRTLVLYTSQPGVQVYTANHLNDRFGWNGNPYGPHHGVCLETQHFPDTPNRPSFPSTRLDPGETYREVSVFQFDW
jgi:aldose 1-epimerase